MIGPLKHSDIHDLADALCSYCGRAQSERLENLQQRSLLLQADQAKALQRISDGLNDLQNRLRSGLEAGYSQHQQGHFTTADVDSLQERLQSLSLTEQNVKKQQVILESLTFEGRPVRHTQIATAHVKTFEWALRTDEDPTLGPSIGAWLQRGNGIFWVSGKPGSGKSTLMKYIADSNITSHLISEWAQPCRAAITSHYFWITGTSMQKSQQGLLQTLMYDIFRQCPDVIEQTCVKRWNSAGYAASWSLAELHETLRRIVSRDHHGLKLCFFIDGLDEYSGDHEDRTQLCRTLKGLTASGNVKLCLSSRPWNIFEEELGEFPKLYMQDLTRDDIQNFVSSRLQEHKRWASVSANHSQGQWLVSEIVAKSNGVFLWVFLVTKLLREGLTNRDAFVDLRRRLESFPSELEPFFKTMLEAVDPFYYSHMSTALQIANASISRRLTFLAYSFHFQEYEDSDYAINHPIRVMNEAEVEEIRSNTSWHLDSRTRGLLEVNPQDGTVTFLHRTAKDFLNTQEMYDFLISKADCRLNFSPILSLLKAHVAMIKTSSLPQRITRTNFGNFEVSNRNHHGNATVLDLILEALSYARDFESHMAGDIRHRTLLDELDRSLPCMLSSCNCEIARRWPSSKQTFLREQMVQFGLFDYLLSKLDSEPDFLENIGPLPVLRFLTADPTESLRFKRGPGVDILIRLLDNYFMDPNEEDEYQGISPWNELLAYICAWWSSERKSATHNLSFLLKEGILKMFLKAGADPSAPIVGPSSTSADYLSRAATLVYLECCFDFLDQSPLIQELYLEVLSEFLRLSSDGVLRNVVAKFYALCSDRDKEELHWKLPFLARVSKMLRLILGARESVTIKSLQFLDELDKRIFPSNPYAPVDVAKGPSRSRKRRKQERVEEV